MVITVCDALVCNFRDANSCGDHCGARGLYPAAHTFKRLTLHLPLFNRIERSVQILLPDCAVDVDAKLLTLGLALEKIFVWRNE